MDDIQGYIHAVPTVSIAAIVGALQNAREYLMCEAYVLGPEGEVMPGLAVWSRRAATAPTTC